MPVQREDFTKKSSNATLFEKYADGKVWAFIKGTQELCNLPEDDPDHADFVVDEKSFAAEARSWGQRHGYKTSAYMAGPGVVEVQSIKQEPVAFLRDQARAYADANREEITVIHPVDESKQLPQ